jgi:hypothetical protein
MYARAVTRLSHERAAAFDCKKVEKGAGESFEKVEKGRFES